MKQQTIKSTLIFIIVQSLVCSRALAENNLVTDQLNALQVQSELEPITSADYELCQANKKNCTITCNAIADLAEQRTCFAKCPICPIPVTSDRDNQVFFADATGQACCTVVTPGKKQIRLCGAHCKAPVMRAIPEISCNATDAASCKTKIRYIPYQKKQRPRTKKNPNLTCFYVPKWPFVTCPDKALNAAVCPTQCLELQYVFILRYGIPNSCKLCFDSFKYHSTDASDDDMINESPSNANAENKEWVLEKSKCLANANSGGLAVKDCDNEEAAVEKLLSTEGVDLTLTTENPNSHSKSTETFSKDAPPLYDDNVDPLEDSPLDENHDRITRNSFQRSKYSVRNKNIS